MLTSGAVKHIQDSGNNIKKMKHVKLFESFNEEKTKITINFKIHTDGILEGKSVGISKNPLYSAMFALAAADNWIKIGPENDLTVQTLQHASEIIKEFYTDEEAYSLLSGIENGIINPEFYTDEGSSSRVSCNVEKVKSTWPDGGYIFSAKVDGNQQVPDITFEKI
jgi:hypothetical protein